MKPSDVAGARDVALASCAGSDGKGARTASAAVNNKTESSARRGHFKSRLGCFSCKRRRVKCNELRPSCSSCVRLGLVCDYPRPFIQSGPTSSLASTFSLQDLQFYHRFLTTAFPPLPLRADDVWAKCAAMSYQSECLAHAALGLGASHLSSHGVVDYTPQALSHRVKAIKLVNEQFASPPRDSHSADALFAALICLVTQTSLMPDAMVEYLTVSRAGALIWAFVIPEHKTSLFSSFTHESHDEALSSVVSEEPKRFEIPNEFLESVTELRKLCHKPHELFYCQRIVAAIEGLFVSSLQAYKAHANLWRAHCFFDNDTFAAFVDPNNYVAQLLIIHMFLLDYVLGPFCVSSSEQFKFPARKRTILSWARNLLLRLPPRLKRHGEWIEKYCDVLQRSDDRSLLTP